MAEFEAVIGLEVHAQLSTLSKLFSCSGTDFAKEPNSLCDPVVLGLPGALPVMNKKAADYAIRLGLATNCQIAETSVFARKHYFYPDLPKGYQISQYEKPICEHGHLDIRVEGEVKKIGITRIHLEEDAGKNTHLESEPYSLVDLNRAGTPLVEIVSEPDIRSAKEAGAYMRKIRQIVRYVEVCDGNMEEGSLRCDANVSIREKGASKFGTKVEIKNINSFRYVEKAIEYEIERQTALIEQGQNIVQETRLWDEAKNVTRSMRSKEFAADYRYMPDPDLPVLFVDEGWIDNIKEDLPELPDEVFARFKSVYKLDDYLADLLSDERLIADYFDKAVSAHNNPKIIANWITTELFGRLNKESQQFADCPISPENLGELVRLIDDGTISGKIAKTVFEEMYDTSATPDSIISKKGLKQISDPSQIEAAIDEIISNNKEQVEAYKGGKQQLFGFFVGQTMKATQGKANPQMVNDLLKKKLS